MDRLDREQAHRGPWDSADPSRTSAPQDWTVVDLGALIVNVPHDVELRMEVREEDQAVLGLEVETSELVMQLMAYAGPRSANMWDDVRQEIGAAVVADGGTYTDRTVDEQTHLIVNLHNDGQPIKARFMGYDGPRWFVRAVISGERAHEDSAIGALQEIIDNLVVVRDDVARPMQEPLELSLPSGPAQVL